MFSTRGFLLSLLFVALLLAVAEGKKKCKKATKNLKLGSMATLRSPKFSKKNPVLPCKKKTFEYKSPSGSKLMLTCSNINIKCNKNKSYLQNSVDNMKRCGKSTFSVTSKSNNLKVKYFSSNKNKKRKPFLFDCKVKAIDDGAICKMCGTRTRSVATVALSERSGNLTKIVGGTQALLKEFPYQAFILITKFGGQFQCGGSLVTEQWLVSAAHCDIKKGDSVILGAHDVTSLMGHEQLILVEEGIPHPSYDRLVNNRYDIAVVKLEEKVKFNDYVQPICLPDPFQTTDFVGQSLEATGWGTIVYQGPVSKVLLKVTLPVITNGVCAAAGSVYTNNVFDDNICTLTPGKDTCQGDSGGPLAYHTEDKSFLIGATSYGEGCAFTNKPGVYVKVSDPQILKWVKNTIGITCSATV